MADGPGTATLVEDETTKVTWSPKTRKLPRQDQSADEDNANTLNPVVVHRALKGLPRTENAVNDEPENRCPKEVKQYDTAVNSQSLQVAVILLHQLPKGGKVSESRHNAKLPPPKGGMGMLPPFGVVE